MFGIDDLLFMLAGTAYATVNGVNAGANRTLEKQYIENMGFNRERQTELEQMAYSVDQNVRKQFDCLVSRTVDRKLGFDVKLAIREISIREGWRYYDISELCSDPYYVKLIGGKWPKGRKPHDFFQKAAIGQDKALEMVAETEHRKDWIRRCPHGDEVTIFPMDFRTEDEYRASVEKTFFEMERENFYNRYATYRKSNTKQNVKLQIDMIEDQWLKYQQIWCGIELIDKICRWVINVFAKTGDVTGFFMVIREKCEMEGFDWESVLTELSCGDTVRRMVRSLK